MTTQTQDFATEQDLDKLFEELDMLGEMHSTPAEQPSAPAAEPQPQVVQQTVTAPSPQPQAVPEPPVQQVITPEPTPVASTPQAMFANFNVGGMLKHAEGKVELEPETQTPPPQQQTTLQPPVPERVDNDADQKLLIKYLLRPLLLHPPLLLILASYHLSQLLLKILNLLLSKLLQALRNKHQQWLNKSEQRICRKIRYHIRKPEIQAGCTRISDRNSDFRCHN